MSSGKFPNKFWMVTFMLICSSVFFYACKSVLKKSDSKTQASSTHTEEKPVIVKNPRILVFSKTSGFYHKSIPAGIAALQEIGKNNNIIVDTTKNSNYFVEDSLKNYSAVVFLSTTMNVLDADQQVAFERYIQAGGGFMGIHAATDTEYNWPWYNKLVGAYFSNHPHNQDANILVTDTTHLSTNFLPKVWTRHDEWYNFKNINPNIKVLAYLDEDSYKGGKNNGDHPIIWYHEFDGGRSFYTGGGHTDESFSEPLFLQHLLGGLKYAIGDNVKLDYSKSYAVKTPEDNRFTKTILSDDLNEPMELSVAPDGRVFFIERAGKFFVYDPTTNKTTLVRDFPVKAVDKYLNGLLGMTIDPDFNKNNFIYFFHTSSEKDQLMQNISRFVISKDSKLDLSSEKVIIQFPIEAEVSAHTGGSLAWDKHKNLYISTGDNTVPFQSGGYAPIDYRENRITFDAGRSSGNTNDLRGKILRITPQEDGSYTIPEGNLFPKGTPLTKPEIYVMGCRNPYRISVDQETSILYWGEIGPDAGNDGKPGPKGYDEINQAKKAGNYGWPFFVGDNKAYNEYNFETKVAGNVFDPSAPQNNSPHNTGLKVLPPTEKAMIWYPYSLSPEFPELGLSGRCAMGGPVYNFDPNLKSETKLPEYFDKALFIYDWMRNWVFAVRFDENQTYKRMEPFMATNGDFKRPVDLEIGPDGVFYMLEYGSVYGIDNVDARLVRIDYNGGNRNPITKITSKDTIGLAPYKVALSSQRSFDPDEDDKLTYEWKFEGNTIGSKESNPTHTFEKNGIFNVTLKITDQFGAFSTDTLQIKVGNTKPIVKINTTENSSFFFPGRTPFKHTVTVKDNEDKVIDLKKVNISLNYIDKVISGQAQEGHQQVVNADYNSGKILIANSDCKACHQMNSKSVGPSFMQISNRYLTDKGALNKLANKVIMGGGGVWGPHAMNAHPQLSKQEATEMVKYVLSLAKPSPNVKLPMQGSRFLLNHLDKPDEGRYVVTASYTDKGGAITPLTGEDKLILRPAKFQAEDADLINNITNQKNQLGAIHHDSYFVLKQIDLKGINKLTYRYASLDKNATIEVRLNSAKGTVISTLDFTATGDHKTFKVVSASIKDPGGKNDLYFVFKKEEKPNQHLATLDWISFSK